MVRKVFFDRRLNVALVLLLIVGLVAGLSAGVTLSSSSVAEAKGPVSLRDAVTAGKFNDVALADKANTKLSMSGKQMLFIDGQYYESAGSSVVKQVSDVVKSGVPVVIFGSGMEKLASDLGGNIPHQTAQYEINGSLVDIPIAAYGIKMCPGVENDDGEPVFDIITVAGGPSDIADAVSTAREWAGSTVSNAAQASSGSQVPISGAVGALTAAQPQPYFGAATQFTYSTANSWQPYGRLNIVTNWKKLQNDGSSTYDWRELAFQVQSVPGQLAFSNSPFCTSDIWVSSKVNEAVSSYVLTDYDPTSTAGVGTVGVSIGVSAGSQGAMVTAGESWTYSISDVIVHDQSDYYTNTASWWHDVNEKATVGSSTYQIKPGLVYRLGDGQKSTIIQRYQAQYGRSGFPGWAYWKSPVIVMYTYVS